MDNTTAAALRSFVGMVRTGIAFVSLTQLCLDANALSPMWWADSTTTYIEHTLSQCGNTCFMYANTTINRCQSSCPTCLRACAGSIVRDAVSLAVYDVTPRCQVITGSLVLDALEYLSEADLANVFSSIVSVEGGLVITNNEFLVGLESLRSLHTASFVSIQNNPSLVSAALPSLNATTPIFVTNNPRLCTAAQPLNNGLACGEVSLNVSFILTNLNFTSVSSTAIRSALLARLPLNASLTTIDLLTPNSTFGGLVTLTTRVSASASFLLQSQLANITTLVLPTLPSTSNTSNVTATLTSAPRRFLVPGFGFNTGIALTSAAWASGQYVLSFTPLVTNDTAFYQLQMVALPSAEIVSALMDLLSPTYGVSSYHVLEAYIAMTGWQSFPLGDQTTLALSNCVTLSNATAAAPCLSPGITTAVRVRANVGVNIIDSNDLILTVPDIALLATNLSVLVSGQQALFTWEAPYVSPVLNDSIVSYTVQLSMQQPGNALTASSSDAAFTTELVTLAGNHMQSSANFTFYNLSGCYLSLATAQTECLRPWTTYLVTLRAITTQLSGQPVTIRFVTDPAPPANSPRNITIITVTATSATYSLIVGDYPTAPVTAIRATGFDSRGRSYTIDCLVTSSALDQAQSPGEPFIFIIPDLQPFTAYNFTFAAVTDVGIGGSSTSYAVNTSEGVPLKMALPTIVKNDTTGLYDVTWVEPYPLPGNIIRYDLFRDCGNETINASSIVCSGLDTSCSISEYCAGVSVRAVTSAGEGDYSDAAQPASASGSSSSSVGTGIIVAAIGCAVVAMLIVFAVVRHVGKKKEAGPVSSVFDPGPVDERWEFPRDRLVLGRQLGSGAFGIVYEAIASRLQEFSGQVRVAVKQCGGDNVRTQDKEDFIAEANLMKRFADPWHRNVVRFLGMCTREEPLLIITELMERGDLKSLLRDSRPPYPGAQARLSQAQLVLMMEDVAQGMAFLAERQYVHRDLAARNCLVAADYTVKISDFGLSRFLAEKDYYRKDGEALLPVRWMAPECLYLGKFDTTSDVWSLGIVLWEIITFGNMPYPDLANQEVFDRVLGGYRMEQPNDCPDAIYDMMAQCWRPKPQRPTFFELAERLHDVQVRLAQRRNDSDLACSAAEHSEVDASSVRVNSNATVTTAVSRSAYVPLGSSCPEGNAPRSPISSINDYVSAAPLGSSPSSMTPLQSGPSARPSVPAANDYHQNTPVQSMPPFKSHPAPLPPRDGCVDPTFSSYSPLPIKQQAPPPPGPPPSRGVQNNYQLSAPPLYIHPPSHDQGHSNAPPPPPSSPDQRGRGGSANAYVPVHLQQRDEKMYDPVKYG
eukprot:m.240914 g.240914  ORF g.240914 m.240914 type:complete len:1323 (+) comp23804_c0_seq1:1450-5418(+)